MINFVGYHSNDQDAEKAALRAGLGTQGIGGSEKPLEVGTFYQPIEPISKQPVGWPRAWIRKANGDQGWQDAEEWWGRVGRSDTLTLEVNGGVLIGKVPSNTVDAAKLGGLSLAQVLARANDSVDDKLEMIVKLLRPVDVSYHPNKGQQTGDHAGQRFPAEFIGQWLRQWIRVSDDFTYIKIWVSGGVGDDSIWYPARMI